MYGTRRYDGVLLLESTWHMVFRTFYMLACSDGASEGREFGCFRGASKGAGRSNSDRIARSTLFLQSRDRPKSSA